MSDSDLTRTPSLGGVIDLAEHEVASALLPAPLGSLGAAGKRPSLKVLSQYIAALPELKGKEQVATLTEEQSKVAACWASALKLPVTTFEPKSNFFDFGGSLAFVALASTIQADLAIEIKVGTLLTTPTVEQMAVKIFSSDEAAKAEPAFDPIATAANFPVQAPPPQAGHGHSALDTAAARREATLAKHHALASKRVLVTGCTGYVGAFVLQARLCTAHS